MKFKRLGGLTYSGWLLSLFLMGQLFFARAAIAVKPVAHPWQQLPDSVQYWAFQRLKAGYEIFRNPGLGTTHKGRGHLSKGSKHLKKVLSHLYQVLALEPYRVDLLFTIASIHIYNVDIQKALEVYQQILTIKSDDQDAHTYLAVWSRHQNNPVESCVHELWLKQHAPVRAEKVRGLFTAIDHAMTMPLITNPIPSEPAPDVLIVLGYELNHDGTPKPPLVDRLKKGIALAHQFPWVPIILSGGSPRSGVTEAAVMRQWLLQQGIAAHRILCEDRSRSTLENALFTHSYLLTQKFRRPLLITSLDHIRRAHLIFELSFRSDASVPLLLRSIAAPPPVAPCTAVPLNEGGSLSVREKAHIYRDALKGIGLWTFRSDPFLER